MILDTPERIRKYKDKAYWDDITVYDLFKRNVEKYPDFVALVDPLNRSSFTLGDPQRFTFLEMDKKVDQLATAFLNAGIVKDDIVGVFLPNVWELILTYLAIARIGAIANPYPPSLREFEIAKMGGFTEIKAMVTTTQFKDRNLVDIVQVARKSIPSLEMIFGIGLSDGEDEYSLENIFTTDYDSGV